MDKETVFDELMLDCMKPEDFHLFIIHLLRYFELFHTPFHISLRIDPVIEFVLDEILTENVIHYFLFSDGEQIH